MANTQKYLNHLLQTFGFSPAGSGDEQVAADEIATIFKRHGFNSQIEPVSAVSIEKAPRIIVGLLTFIGAILTVSSGIMFWIGFLLCILSAVFVVFDYLEKQILKPFVKTI